MWLPSAFCWLPGILPALFLISLGHHGGSEDSSGALEPLEGPLEGLQQEDSDSPGDSAAVYTGHEVGLPLQLPSTAGEERKGQVVGFTAMDSPPSLAQKGM